MRRGTGILPVRSCGIGILPMIHGLEVHTTGKRLSSARVERAVKHERPAPGSRACLYFCWTL